ncbi:MAG TPA: N-acetyltransferase [Verrucomicrobiae bacterium]|nr:N-acetyltransferase [Verrucomicrobiae bacterium]
MKARCSPAPVKFKVRRYEENDFETLYAIDQLCYAPEIAYSRAELRRYLAMPEAECWVAANEGAKRGGAKIGGFIVATSRGAHGHILTIDVLEKFRRAGVGRLLLRRAEREMEKRGAREIWLETAVDNKSAIAFWKNRGYVTRGRLPHYYPTGVDALAMSKNLAKALAEE